jgi:uroporphyrin-3 C-methyltransferase
VVEKTETPQILDEISKANAKADTRPRNQKKARRRFIIVAALFLSFLGAVSYLGWQQNSFQQTLDSLYEKNQEMELLVETQNNQIFEMQKSISQVPYSENLSQLLREEIANLRQQFENLSSQQSSQRFEPDSDWKLHEALFFLRMANQKLQLQGDIVATISLIENADVALLNSGNNNTFPIREALAESLSELRDTEVVDREGIFIRLGNLHRQAEKIKLMSEQNGIFSNQIEPPSALTEIESDGTSIFDSLLEFISSVFVLRDWADKSEFILAGGQPELIRQNLYLMLEQARFAVIAKDKTLYQESLANSKKWFEMYLSPGLNSGLPFAEEISSLMLIDINPPLPSLDEPLYLLSLIRPMVEAVR